MQTCGFEVLTITHTNKDRRQSKSHYWARNHESLIYAIERKHKHLQKHWADGVLEVGHVYDFAHTRCVK